MARMVPDAMPDGRSRGEQRLFARLQSLPDDCLVYYEPPIGDRYPDFVVIIPDAGLLVIEAKGWLAHQILGGDSNSICVQANARESQNQAPNPIRQARDYMYRLMDGCKRHPAARHLLHATGTHEGKFVFPFGYCTVLTQITEEELRTHRSGNLRTILPAEHVVAADEFDAWPAFTGDQLQARLASFFSPRWPFPRMTARQIDALRTILHPEVLVPATPAELAEVRDLAASVFLEGADADIRSLDAEQERVARSLGGGHRLLFGVAGSGKTIVLVARAKFLSEALPTGRILVLCFNVAFKAYLAALLRSSENVDVLTFHGWGARNGVKWIAGEDPERYGSRLLGALEAGEGDSGRYHAVLIDEAQDFDPTWFKCARAAMKEPRGGDLLIVGDRNQTSYHRGQVSWAVLGVRAKGRSKILRQNYRNTRPILAAAAPFADETQEDDGIAATRCDPAGAVRESAIVPMVFERQTRQEEIDCIDTLVASLLTGCVGERKVPALKPSEIGLLYRHYDPSLPAVIARLAAAAPVVWLTPKHSPTETDPRQRVLEPGIKVQTIHSAKGLQYRAVVLMFADQLARGDADLEQERRLLYVALTRPEDILAVTCTRGPADRVSSLLETLLASSAFVKA
jgi:UvrD-like helicase family protein/AAA domain-containing protein/nuclease-like protein